MADNRIQVIIEALDKTSKEFNDLKRKLKDLENEGKAATSGLNGAFASLKKNWLETTAVIAGAVITIRSAWNMAEGAAAFEEQKASLNSLAAEYNTTADEIIDSVKRASNGLISMSEAANVSAKALMMGLNPQQLTDLMKIAEATTNVTGQKVGAAFQDLISASATGRERTLKQMGIIVDLNGAYETYAKSIGRTSDELTEFQKQQVGVNAILTKGAEIQERLGESTDSTADKMERFTVMISDSSLIAGKIIIKVFAGISAVLFGFSAVVWEVVYGVSSAFNGLFKLLEKIPGKTGAAFKALKGVSQAVMDVAETARKDAAKKVMTSVDAIFDSSEKSKGKGASGGSGGGDNKPSKLAAEWAKVKADLALDVSKIGLDEFQQKVQETWAKFAELEKTYGKKPEIKTWLWEKLKGITDEQHQKEFETQYKNQQDMRKAADDFEKNITEAKATELEKRLLAEDDWVQKQRELLFAAGTDYETYQLRMLEVTTTAEEKKKKIIEENSKAVREAAINFQLAQVDVAEKDRTISKTGAISERINLNKELVKIQEEHLLTLDKLKDPASWYAQQQGITATRGKLLELNEALKEQTGTFSAGAQEGFRRYIDELKTTFQQGVEIARATASAMESAFSDFFFDAFQGKLKTLADYLKSFLTSVQRALAQAMSQKLVGSIISSIGGLAGGGGTGPGGGAGAHELSHAFHSGGMVLHKGGYIPRFHFGGSALGGDEVPAILQRGEYVVSRRGVAAMDAINRGDVAPASVPSSSGEVHNYYYIQAVDAKSFADLVERNPGAITKIMQDDARRGGSLWR